MRMYCKGFFQCAIMKALESEVITKSKYKRIAQSEQKKKLVVFKDNIMDDTDFQTHIQT